MTRVEKIGRATLYLGDSRRVLEEVPRADCVFADPPYGVNFKGSATKHSVSNSDSYISFDDTPENIKGICVPIIDLCRVMFTRVCVTPGIRNSRCYANPDAEGVIWYPSGANRGPWGFVMHQPIFYYGKCPYLANGLGSRPTSFQSTEPAEKNGHPCPKPIGQMKWIVKRISLENETILDPFMGSGTTGVAAVQLQRDFIGIEIEPKYFDIACRRIEEAQKQRHLFAEAAS